MRVPFPALGAGRAAADTADFLDEELARADVVPSEAIEPTVATMNSRVEFADLATGQRRCVTIAYPDQADPRGRAGLGP